MDLPEELINEILEYLNLKCIICRNKINILDNTNNYITTGEDIFCSNNCFKFYFFFTHI